MIAGVLLALPGMIAIMALIWIYVIFGDVALVSALFFVLQAVVRVGRRALKHDATRLVAAPSFVAIFRFDAPFPAIVLAAALIGTLGARTGLQAFAPGGGHG